MIGAAFLMLLATPAELPSPATKPAKTESKSCREMILSSSRLGVTKVCKTRAQWRRYDDCHKSVTRYCSPKKKLASVGRAKPGSAAMSPLEGLRIVCKSVTATGSRLATQQVCLPKREWARMAEEANDTATKEVMGFSKRPERGCTASGCW